MLKKLLIALFVMTAPLGPARAQGTKEVSDLIKRSFEIFHLSILGDICEYRLDANVVGAYNKKHKITDHIVFLINNDTANIRALEGFIKSGQTKTQICASMVEAFGKNGSILKGAIKE